MTTPLISQGCYASAMGSLDWLDTSYSPLQLIEKYKLPTLVRLCEGYYGNTSNSCFSAMDVIKLHEIQRVDMIVVKISQEVDGKFEDGPEPVRLCFPKNFAGRFDPIHQAGEQSSNKPPKCFKTVRKMAEMTPHFIKVKKKPCKKGEGPDKDDILEILGLALCDAWWEDRGFLRCRKLDGEEVMLNLKWGGLYEAIPDPEGYTLQDMLKRFVLPCKVTLRDPQSHLRPESDLLKFLPEMEGTLVLEREITHEFLIGTAVDTASLAQNLVHRASGVGTSARARSSRQQTAAVPWVVLTKNANVLFQICQDMVHKRATYMSLLEMFGDCCMDRIPMDLFICEYATPFVAFTRSEEPPFPTAQQTDDAPCVASKPSHSRSAPDLSRGESFGACNNAFDDPADHKGARPLRPDPEVERRMNQRELPPLPPEADPSRMSKLFSGTTNIPGRQLGTLAPIIREYSQTVQKDMAIPILVTTAADNGNHEDGDHENGPYTKPIDPEGYEAMQLTSASPSTLSSSPRDLSTRAKPHISCMTMPLPTQPHPDPPRGFSSQPGHTKVEEIKTTVRGAASRDAPPSREPPPPPPRTTPRRKPSDVGHLTYGNIETELLKTPSEPKSTPPRPSRVPPAPRPRKTENLKSRSFHQSSHRRDLRLASPPHDLPFCTRPSSLTTSDYLKPRPPRSGRETSNLPPPVKSLSLGSIIDELSSCDSLANDANTVREAPVQCRPVTPCKPTRRIDTVDSIPSDISTLTSSELAQCLRLLKLDEEIVTRFHSHQINGSLLVQLSSQTVRSELALTDFEAEKLDAFRRGWRPDSEV
ncbi:uncharacterized protein LOC110980678 isoform X2 [Acanthaster planci]|uniref:Uncharacterized protein LOC110980678 isoform X2 n=1 Tax=Acanthaster planci TaxID=133434 RepID=A0A8B7YLF6_ACAPL|nr:uncharacterized protein LOC110980678 isoform X2 [Acanthaster planci]